VRQIASKLRSYAFGRSGNAAREAEHAVCQAYRGVSFIRHTACAGFAAAARQIASKLRSYAFGRSGNAARTNLLVWAAFGRS